MRVLHFARSLRHETRPSLSYASYRESYLNLMNEASARSAHLNLNDAGNREAHLNPSSAMYLAYPPNLILEALKRQ